MGCILGGKKKKLKELGSGVHVSMQCVKLSSESLIKMALVSQGIHN